MPSRKSKRGRIAKKIHTPSQQTPTGAITPGPTKRSNLSRTPLLDLPLPPTRGIPSHSTPRRGPNQFESQPPTAICNHEVAAAPSASIRLSFNDLADNNDNAIITSPTTEGGNISPPPAASPSFKHECLRQLFALVEKDASLQQQWWALPTLVAMINRLNKLSIETQLLPGVSMSQQYTARQMIERLRKDATAIVAQTEYEFGLSEKHVFIRSFKIDNKNISAIYIDMSTAPKEVTHETIDSPHTWFKEDLFRKRHSLVKLAPPKLYELINPWYSTEFETLFATQEGETAREAAEKMLEILTKAQRSCQAAKAATVGLQSGEKTYYVDGKYCDDDDKLEVKLDPTAVERLGARHQERATYMRKALVIALEADAENCKLTWGSCCQKAVDAIQECMGESRLGTNGGRTVESWFRSFKVKRLFDNPLIHEKHGISYFINNPSSALKMREFGNDNLATLSIDRMHDFIHTKELPRLTDNRRKKEKGFTKKKLLEESGLKKLCPNTVHSWMLFLGFRRDIYRKGFYTDNHERADVVKHRIEYCLDYFELEKRCAVWVQLPLERANQLKLAKRLFEKNNGYRYAKEDNEWVEYHVDDIKDAWMLAELKNNKDGGNLSVRKPPDLKRIFMWGQDEVVCHEKQLSSMCWMGTDGRAPVRAKDKGAALMISGFVNRDVGWMPVVSEAQLIRINNRRSGNKYLSEDAAIEVFDSTDKKPFTMEDVKHHCFRWWMHPGVNHDGYWNCNFALVQLENVMDVGNALWPHVHHIAYFDHSMGHKAKRKNGLDIAAINKGVGGRQPTMRDTLLDHPSCIGEFSNNGVALTLGALQSCVFSEQCVGPAWMTADEQLTTKYDRSFEGEFKKRTLRSRKEVFQFLRQQELPPGVLSDNIDKVSLVSLREIAKQHGIKLSVEEPRFEKGWINQAKGAFQLCFERGLVDISKGYEYYTMDGKKDDRGTVIKETSLKHLLGGCCDFKNEMTMIEWVADQYGWQVLFSPKCHPEIAGMGVEYVWATAKNELNSIPISDRRGYAKFKAKVLDHCFSTTVLPKQLVRNQARQSRGYMIGYLMVHAAAAKKARDSSGGNTADEDALSGRVSLEELRNTITHIPCQVIKKARKNYKRHRGIAMFMSNGDGSFDIGYEMMPSVPNNVVI